MTKEKGMGMNMARPRKQTYTLKMYLDKIKDGDIDNNADVQRKMVWSKEQINELIVTVLMDEYIPPIILGEESNSQLHIADGGCRSAALNSFRNGTHKITASIEDSVISYKKKTKDKTGNIIWEDAVFDIKNKTYAKLPEELKKKFDEYQIETVIHENCDSRKISRYIKRYNNHVAMNTDQKAFTYIDRFAGYVRKILDSRFFLDYSDYSENDKTKGTVERIVLESIMCTNHFDHWRKQPKAVCKYLNSNATEEEFARFADDIRRLEAVVTDDVKDIFNKKDSFIFLTLFDRFTGLGIDDRKFIAFLRVFKTKLRNTKRSERGMLFDEIDRDCSTKDKTVIAAKLAMLEKLMREFLGMRVEEKKPDTKKRPVTAKEIIAEYIDEDVADEDMELFEIMANDISEAIEDIDSWFLSEENRPSFVALVGYAVKEDIDRPLKEWLFAYERSGSPLSDQKQNYLHMKADFERFLSADCKMPCYR